MLGRAGRNALSIAVGAALSLGGCGACSDSDGASERAASTEHDTPEPTAAGTHADPASVAGRWSYRTESNCGSTEGVGELRFDWQPEAERYRERGCVHWPDSGTTIWWWGKPRYDAEARRLIGTNRNSLGDTVDGEWALKGPGPERLVVTWKQSNGCEGRGIATRGTARTRPRVGSPVLFGTLDPDDDDSPCDARRAGPEMWPDDAE